MKRVWLFYFETGPGVGLGHARRSLTLAQGLADCGDRVLILCPYPDLVPVQWMDGLECLGIKGNGSVERVLREIETRFRDNQASGLVVDSYGYDRDILSKLRHDLGPKAVLALIGNWQAAFAQVDVFIRQSVLEQPILEKGPAVLGGAPYMLRRPDLGPVSPSPPGEEVRNLVVVLGGGSQCPPALLQALSGPLGPRPVEINILLDLPEKITPVQESVNRLNWLGLQPNPAPFFRAADAALSGCGTVLAELAALGVPALGLALAENQYRRGMEFQEAGVINYLGPAGSISAEEIRGRLRALINDPVKRQEMSRQGKNLIDGQGARRCAAFLRQTARDKAS